MLDAAFDRADPRPMSEALDKAKTFVRERGPTIAVEIGVNFALPLLVFDYAKPSLGEVHALMVSSGPPIVWSLIEFARKRRVDALSIIVLAGIGLSLLMFLGGGSRFTLQRDSLVSLPEVPGGIPIARIPNFRVRLQLP